MQRLDDMATSTAPPTIVRSPIVIALDDSEYADIVLQHGLDQAARHDAPDLHVITVVDGARRDLDPFKDALARRVIEGLEAFGDRSSWRTRIHVRCGKPAEEIANLAGEISARLLVIGRFGANHRWRSVADRVLELAPCPTLVVGLTGHEITAVPQCPDCVRVRAESDGEVWFCERHVAPDRMRLTLLVPPTTSDLRGGIW
jgi:nucleotide-binding universal stress UspA family protein